MMSMISGHALKADVKAKDTVNGRGTWQKQLRPLVDGGGEQRYSTAQEEHGAFYVDIGQCSPFVSTQRKLLG